MDNTFDHGTNYTGVPTMSVNADPCDPSSLSDPGGQGHVPIWNELLNNSDFFDDYLNRWQDLANGYLSCDTMIAVLDSMIAVIDPEMPRQIAKWEGHLFRVAVKCSRCTRFYKCSLQHHECWLWALLSCAFRPTQCYSSNSWNWRGRNE